MLPALPDFDHNLVLPPHTGDPRDPSDLSPYPCTSLELCRRFATSPQRRTILRRFLEFRKRIHECGITRGLQWLGGSFLEDVETREGRPPNDLDVVTLYWGYDLSFQRQVNGVFPEFADRELAKAGFRLDHFPFDVDYSPETTVDMVRYWIQLFSHNRTGVWKGMVSVALGTPEVDHQGLAYLQGPAP